MRRLLAADELPAVTEPVVMELRSLTASSLPWPCATTRSSCTKDADFDAIARAVSLRTTPLR